MALARGESLRLSCKAEVPGGMVTWFYEESEEQLETGYLTHNKVIELDNLNSYHTGSYLCHGQKHNGDFFLDKIVLVVYGKFRPNKPMCAF